MLDTLLQATFPETLQKPVWTFEKVALQQYSCTAKLFQKSMFFILTLICDSRERIAGNFNSNM